MSSRVAVGICTYHRPRQLERLMLALQQLDLGDIPADQLRIFVIDNDPQAENAAICERANGALPFTIEYREEANSGVTYARNHAAAAALAWGADFLAFIDDDDIPRPDWLLRLLEQQSATGADLVFGSWRPAADTPEWALRAGIFRDPSRFKALGGAGRYGLPNCASTCNVMASRRILEKLDSQGDVFDHRFRLSGGEDKDFFIRARESGATLASADDSIIDLSYEAERFEAKGLLRRGFKGGCSQAVMARTYGSLGKRVVMISKAAVKIVLVALTLPLTLVHRPLMLHHLYRLGKCAGVLHALSAKQAFNYYARGEQS